MREKCYHFCREMLTFSSHNTNIYKTCKLHRAKFSLFYNISPPNFAVLLILRCPFKLSFQAVMRDFVFLA